MYKIEVNDNYNDIYDICMMTDSKQEVLNVVRTVLVGWGLNCLPKTRLELYNSVDKSGRRVCKMRLYISEDNNSFYEIIVVEASNILDKAVFYEALELDDYQINEYKKEHENG